MPDLEFQAEVKWSGTGRNGEGRLELSDHSLRYSAPDSMGGKGVGTSPEELLLAAVTTCYSGTLFGVLKKSSLPATDVSIRTEGTVTGYPLQSKFARIRVNPTVHGGNPDQTEDYERLAEEARNRCFIGKTVIGNVEYVVGEVRVINS